MSDTELVVTPSLFYQYKKCPHWIWHDIFSDPKTKGQFTELTLKLFEQGNLHEKDYVKDLDCSPVLAIDSTEAFNETMELMKQGVELIYQGEIQFEKDGIIYRGRPDLLKKFPGKSRFGDYYYYPIDIKSSKEVSKEQKFQLILYAIILEELQQYFPEKLEIVNSEMDTVDVIISPSDKEEALSRIYEIIEIMKGAKPELKLVSTCKDSPWYSYCVQEAEAANDLALIYKLDGRSHKVLREVGINTVNDVAEMDISSLPKVPYASLEVLERIKIQAKSLLEKRVVWLNKPEIPDGKIKIYFDIEGDPFSHVEYLFGFWVVGDSEYKYANVKNCVKYPEEKKYFVYFLAEKPTDEYKLWEEFLEWLKCLPTDDYYVYHYADYERSRTLSMSKKYSSSPEFEYFCTRLVDFQKIREKYVVFPLYFYSIKDIAKSEFVNFKWRHEKAGGAQSISWYMEWLESNNRDILRDIIDYNEDDVRATEFFHNWLLSSGNK